MNAEIGDEAPEFHGNICFELSVQCKFLWFVNFSFRSSVHITNNSKKHGHVQGKNKEVIKF
jgi:hypothetical protein